MEDIHISEPVFDRKEYYLVEFKDNNGQWRRINGNTWISACSSLARAIRLRNRWAEKYRKNDLSRIVRKVVVTRTERKVTEVVVDDKGIVVT